MSYSKGPWFVVEDTDQVDEFGNGPVHVAISRHEDDVADAVAWMHDGTFEDAVLMAAAPDLLLACKVALSSLRHSGIAGRSPETDMLEAAIRKAAGEQ